MAWGVGSGKVPQSTAALIGAPTGRGGWATGLTDIKPSPFCTAHPELVEGWNWWFDKLTMSESGWLTVSGLGCLLVSAVSLT